MRIQMAFFTLLRAGLWESGVDDTTVFPLSLCEWQGVYDEAKRQTVRGLVYSGICQLPDHFMPSEKMLIQWVAEVDKIERSNRSMNEAISSLTTLFRNKGLRVAILKGQGVAQFYESPLLRESGDIDIYFPHWGDFDEASNILALRNVYLSLKADESICYQWNKIVVEHHRNLFDIANPNHQNFLRSYEDKKGFDKWQVSKKEEDVVEIPSPILNILLLNTHILKHALSWGIGLRQLCDIARALYVLKDAIKFEELTSVIKTLKLTRWTRMLYTFLVDYLNMPVALLPADYHRLSPKPLLKIVERSGNFGQSLRLKNDASTSKWQRKTSTATAFLRQAGFSLKYAPSEALWTFFYLLLGQKQEKQYACKN